MKATELRIGNNITEMGIDWHQGSPVRDIDGDEIIKVDIETLKTISIAISGTIQDRFEPIPLTGQWLKDFEFKPTDIELDLVDEWYVKVINSIGVYVNIKYNSIVLKNEDSKQGHFTLHYDKMFVHTIQNVVYDITNKELTK